jgi:hypothetical protein
MSNLRRFNAGPWYDPHRPYQPSHLLSVTYRFREAAKGGNKKKGALRVALLALVNHVVKFDFQALLSFDRRESLQRKADDSSRWQRTAFKL